MNTLPAVAAHEIVHPLTGEVLDLTVASTEDLAAVIAALNDVRERMAEFQAVIEGVLLQHLDRAAVWTQRAGVYELKAPSPTAGTETYPPDMLRDALVRLVGAGTISEEAASNALQRRLVLELDVPWQADPSSLATAVREAITIQVADVIVSVVKAEAATRISAAGIKALRKVPGTIEALDAAKLTQPAGTRRVKVTRKAPPA